MVARKLCRVKGNTHESKFDKNVPGQEQKCELRNGDSTEELGRSKNKVKV